jgi:hypothetical protein
MGNWYSSGELGDLKPLASADNQTEPVQSTDQLDSIDRDIKRSITEELKTNDMFNDRRHRCSSEPGCLDKK